MEQTVVIIVLVAFLVFQFLVNIYDRKASNGREQDLMAALIAKNLSEYAAAHAKLRTSTKEEIEKIREENKIAMAALEEMEGKGIPVD